MQILRKLELIVLTLQSLDWSKKKKKPSRTFTADDILQISTDYIHMMNVHHVTETMNEQSVFSICKRDFRWLEKASKTKHRQRAKSRTPDYRLQVSTWVCVEMSSSRVWPAGTDTETEATRTKFSFSAWVGCLYCDFRESCASFSPLPLSRVFGERAPSDGQVGMMQDS